MDVILVGTGVSALLLASSLLRRGLCARLRIIGPRRPSSAHVLSVWSDAPTPFDAFVVASFAKLRVCTDAEQHLVSLSSMTYRTFRAQAWADALRREIAALPEVEWIEAAVDEVCDHFLRPSVVVSGERLTADWVFASAALAGKEPSFRQRFVGWEVLLEERTVGLDEATLLDFRTPAEGDFRFVYALPLAENRLFVEHVSYEPCDHERALDHYLRDVVGASRFSIVDREGGATPIYAEPEARGEGRLVPIGVRAGMAKITTGYAVMRMWRDAERIARELAERGVLSPSTGVPSLADVADRFFLDLLRQDRTRIPQLLSALFAKAPGDSVLAFLDDQASWSQQAEVAAAMPGWVRWAVSGASDPEIGL